MAVNKVVFGNTTIMDITDSTVDSDTLLTGTKAYGANGDPVIGGVVKSWTGTAAQYAQEASQIPDGTQVNILDDFTSVGTPIGIADIYSTEEREIGVWIDGKPLYQKTIAYTLGTDLTTIVNADLNNVDVMLPILGIYNSTDNVFRPLTFVFPGVISGNIQYSSSIGYDKTNNTFEIYRSSGLISLCKDLKIIVKYTKTTDQPGSGKYARDSITAILFDESSIERQVGWYKYANGTKKPVYEVNVVGTTPNVYDAWSELIDLNTTIEKILYNYSTISRADTESYPGTYIGDYAVLYKVSSSGKVQIRIKDEYLKNHPFTFTIKYTKTTDTPS